MTEVDEAYQEYDETLDRLEKEYQEAQRTARDKLWKRLKPIRDKAVAEASKVLREGK